MEKFLKCEQTIKSIRKFFDKRGFHEVIIPVLNDAVPLEPNIYPFTTEWHTHDTKTFYLPASPEKHLKKMLAEGLTQCYGIGHSFRDLEAAGPLHTPEFLMLEWYRKDADYMKIMEDVEELFFFLTEKLVSALSQEKKQSWPRLSLITLFKEHAGMLLDDLLEDHAMFTFAKSKGYNTDNSSWHELFDQIFVNEIESKLPKEPFFLLDFPLRISPLCKSQKENSQFAQRFEVYINGVEIGNGNTERTDANAIRKVFEAEQAKRDAQKLPYIPIDESFLDSLRRMESSEYAGIGVGIERLSDAI